MLRLAKAFCDLALWRISPAQLPPSAFLLGLVAALVALIEVAGALVPPPAPESIAARILLSVGLPLAWASGILRLASRRERFLQTAIALLGVGALALLVLYPLDWLSQTLGTDHPAAIPLVFAWLIALVWYMLACAHIWRAALESRLGVGVAVSMGYLLLWMLLEQTLLPDAK
ncbi:MAG TPA: hypothetical protein VKG05_04795 [Steroidobacteraceae bacterium]|nr:hypothetical protein [Steroidobacteraceae bacterium]